MPNLLYTLPAFVATNFKLKYYYTQKQDNFKRIDHGRQ